MSAPRRPARCAFCDHRWSLHGSLGCEQQVPVRLAYGPDKGAIHASRGCPCDLTRIELRDGVDVETLARQAGGK